ncbi:hypothetical protein UI24_10300 [Mycobacteroides franklinii]|nr:hypothetical protein [Mycobacteroides franklinii]
MPLICLLRIACATLARGWTYDNGGGVSTTTGALTGATVGTQVQMSTAPGGDHHRGLVRRMR